MVISVIGDMTFGRELRNRKEKDDVSKGLFEAVCIHSPDGLAG